jgi:hypothetical protein
VKRLDRPPARPTLTAAKRYREDDGSVRCAVCQTVEADVEARFTTVVVDAPNVVGPLPGRALGDEGVPVAGYKCPRSDRVLVAEHRNLADLVGGDWNSGKWVSVEVEAARGTVNAAVPVAWVREALLDTDPADYPDLDADTTADDADGGTNQPDADDAPVRTAAVRDAPDADSDASDADEPDDHEPKNPTDADDEQDDEQDEDDGQATLGTFAGGEP